MSVDGRDEGTCDGAGLEPGASAVHRAEVKRRFLEGALERGKAQVRVDARRPCVKVPPSFTAEPGLALNLSWRFPDSRMVVNERGVAATLKFGGVPFRCELPWSAVWGILAAGDDAVQVWPADLPPELGGPPASDAVPEPQPVEPPPPRLVAMSGGLESANAVAEAPASPVVAVVPSPPSPAPAPSSAPSPARPNHLRLVK